jgi:hypothetical protein
MKDKLSPLIALLLGLVVGAFFAYFVSPMIISSEWWPVHTEHGNDDEYHVHADFLIVVDDKVVDLSNSKYMTTATQTLHEHLHLHDNDDNVLHVHHENITFAEFLSSLNITLTDSCLTLPSKESTCADKEKQLVLFLNNDRFTDSIKSYVPNDLDQILLYVGKNSDPALTTFGSQITDEACIFSGSCPERGIPPPESCGLTCEI